jgi:maltose/moltooligosaccharide transporter
MLAYAAPSLFVLLGMNPLSIDANGIPDTAKLAFAIGAVLSLSTILWSVLAVRELPLTEAEISHMQAEPMGVRTMLRDIRDAIIDMPRTMRQLAFVKLFQWYAMFCYWQFISHSIAKSVWKTTSEANPQLYQEAVGWTGLVNGFYNIVTFLSAFALVGLAKKYSAKYVHVTCLLPAAISLFLIPNISNKYFLFAPMIGFGIAWASMMGVPYIMVVSGIPKERYGVYMGIVNMMIVIPMILQTITFGYVFENFLDKNPGNVMLFAGTLLVLASLATLRIKQTTVADDIELPVGGGH